MKSRYIVGLGEVLWDMLPSGKKLGGAPANFAYHISQFGFNGLAVSAIGDDELGNEILESFRVSGVPHCFQTVAFPTSTVQVTLDEKGIPCYEIVEGVAWDNMEFTDKLRDIAANTECVCFGSLAQRNSVSRNAIRCFLETMPAGSLKVFDINLRQSFYTKEIIEDSIKASSVLKINDDEIKIISEMFGYSPDESHASLCRKMLADFGLEIIILTCGTNGSYVVSEEGCSFLPTPEVKVADTVGAGDSFTAAFCAKYLQGKTLAEAHRCAVETSAFVCTKDGAMPELPEEIRNR